MQQEVPMTFDILESLNSALGGPLIRQLSSALGESEESTRAATRALGPTVLAGLMSQATTPAGAASLFRAVNDGSIDTGIVGKLSGIIGNRGNFESLLGLGESLGGTVFGNRTGALTNALSQVSGVKPNSALMLLSTALPMVFGMLRKQVTQNGLDAGGLTSLLFGQRKSLERAGLDNRITGALGFNNLSGLLGALPPAAATSALRPAPATTERNWWPWAIAAGVAAIALMFFVNRTGEESSTQTALSTQPTQERTRLASASTRVYFGSGEASIDAEDRRKIADVAESARNHDRPVAITGYTDQTGDQEQNLAIAKDRAVAVRDALVAEGVSESRIVMDPPAVVTGTGTDAEARRVDIQER
jgi:outer membrane protein OmpA-like peptidoglycan-associated protein